MKDEPADLRSLPVRPASPGPIRSLQIWLPELTGSKGGIQVFCHDFLGALLPVSAGVRRHIFVKNDHQLPPADLLGSAPAVDYQHFGRWPAGPLRTLAFAGAVLWTAQWSRPDLIIVGHANFAPLAERMRRWWGIPFWVIAHGIEVWGEGARHLGPALGSADRILSVSRYTRDRLLSQGLFRQDQFALLPNTFDEETFRLAPPSAALRQRLGISPGKRIILTICRLAGVERYKGYDQILEALPAILRVVPEAHYVLGGQGNDTSRIRQRVRELGLDDHVTLTGFVPDGELADFYNLCDVFAMPSQREGFGIVFLEALGCGRPVVAGNADGATDALLDGKLGVLVDPLNVPALAETLIQILQGRHPHPLLYQPAELRRQVVNVYGSKRFAATVAKLWQEMTSTASGTGSISQG